MSNTESRYMQRGVSSSKEDVHNAIKNIDKKEIQKPKAVAVKSSSDKPTKEGFKVISSEELLRRRVNVYPYLM